MSSSRSLAAAAAVAAAIAVAPAEAQDWERLQQATEQVRQLQSRLQARERELEQQVERLQAQLEQAQGAGARDERRAGGPREPNPNEACFYTSRNFEGQFFCAKRGNSDASLINEDWSDRISSFRVGGQASVLICDNPNFVGRCIGFDRSRESLPGEWDNLTSSYLVR